MASIFQQEKDSIVLLGLLAIAHKNFDFQYKHPDGELTHQHGLNIFAAIIDNVDGELLAQSQNSIHTFNNPMLHAEQLSLQQAINRINEKRTRNKSTTSVENYYRNFLFNHPDDINRSATLYTTLEPCPFCASALLVTRMKRIVYIIPDAIFGPAFGMLKNKFYENSKAEYERLALDGDKGGTLVKNAKALLEKFHARINTVKEEHERQKKKLYDTLLIDFTEDLLKEAFELFSLIKPSDLSNEDGKLSRNVTTLNGLRSKLRLELLS